MQHLIKQLEVSCLKVRNDYRFYPSNQEQQRLEVYKDLGQTSLSDYNESF